MPEKYRILHLPLAHLETDILVLGSGLAGLRAALAAKIAYPEARVAVATATDGPSGSSFANPNDAFGMQVCRTREEQAAMVGEVLALAAPGQAEPRLVELLAAESQARYLDLKELGVCFAQEPSANGPGAPGCFSPGSRRAAIVKNLSSVFARFHHRLASLQISWLPGWLVAALPATSGDKRVRGALFVSRDEQQALAVQATTTVMALGGPAPLFARHLAGPGNPGYALGLLARARAELRNEGFLQFFWSDVSSRQFFPVHTAFDARFAVETATGMARPLLAHPDADLPSLATSRAGHCPWAYGHPDALLDTALASLADADGVVRLGQGSGLTRVALFAHAGNGGARIDATGHTSVAGLFAAGECAAGMHGANRLGGAMVTATQVFGARAGLAAAMEACLSDPMPQHEFRDLVGAILTKLPQHIAARITGLAALGRALSRNALPLPGAGLVELEQTLRQSCERPTDWMLDLCRESALAVVQAQCALKEQSDSQAA